MTVYFMKQSIRYVFYAKKVFKLWSKMSINDLNDLKLSIFSLIV